MNGENVLVLGLGESGLAMAQWLSRQGARVRVADSRRAPPCAAELRRSAPTVELLTGAFDPALLAGVDRLALSPGLSPREPLVQEAVRRGLAVTGEIALFVEALEALELRRACRLIAITGTNGKTTTTSLVGHLCRAAGRVTAVAGNIGPAALTALMTCLDAGKLPEVWVLELSSFQLETTPRLGADAATVLNISEDHLDRYDGIEDYAASKARIFHGCAVQVLNREDARVAAMADAVLPQLTFGLDAPRGDDDFGRRDAWLMRGRQGLVRGETLALVGHHNQANALAALALCAASGLDPLALVSALREFRGLAHRVERIAQIDGVSWFDDSKGTNVGATVAALEGLGSQISQRASLERESPLGTGAPPANTSDRNDRPTSHLPPSGREAGREGTPTASLGRKVGREGTPLANTSDRNDRPISRLPSSGREAGREGSPTPTGREAGREGIPSPDPSKIILIAGGDGKAQDFTPLGPALAAHARALVLIGRDAPRIEAAVAGSGVPVVRAADMEQAVREAARAARPGDAVLLSPACASYDMFRDYLHRAEVFAQSVRALCAQRRERVS